MPPVSQHKPRPRLTQIPTSRLPRPRTPHQSNVLQPSLHPLGMATFYPTIHTLPVAYTKRLPPTRSGLHPHTSYSLLFIHRMTHRISQTTSSESLSMHGSSVTTPTVPHQFALRDAHLCSWMEAQISASRETSHAWLTLRTSHLCQSRLLQQATHPLLTTPVQNGDSSL